jgi:hypothetical protein
VYYYDYQEGVKTKAAEIPTRQGICFPKSMAACKLANWGDPPSCEILDQIAFTVLIAWLGVFFAILLLLLLLH